MSRSDGLARAAAAGLVVGILMTVLVAARLPVGGEPWLRGRFASNGERIYFTATSERAAPIAMSMGRITMGGMMGRVVACADCHGADGRGGAVTMMMGSFEAPDIRYNSLTQPDERRDGDHADHPAYTDETLRRAITQGVDSAGEPLEFPMPRWRMSDENLDDLVAYLKTLE